MYLKKDTVIPNTVVANEKKKASMEYSFFITSIYFKISWLNSRAHFPNWFYVRMRFGSRKEP